MNRHNKGQFFLLIAAVVVSYFVVIACANRGAGPQGGPKDITPPHPIKSTPKLNALNYKKNRIEIIFDEIVQVEKAFDNVIISPPQKQMPVVKALGKRIVVDLKDTIQENTTYTVFFGDAIVDNNEHNPLPNYTFSFSTGNTIDSLQMSGTLINASDLNPLSGIVVGIHSDLSDSAFIKKPFDRITKTDKNGHFSVSNIKEGKYRIYALGDIGNNFKFDQPNELIAFTDTVFVPYCRTIQQTDTVYRDSIVTNRGIRDTVKVLDTIVNRRRNMFFPDSIILKAFTEDFVKQYLVKSERKDRQHFSLYFNAPNEKLPIVEALNFSFDDKVFIQSNNRKDSITYWLKDSLTWSVDTLKLKLTYQKTDSTNMLVTQVDTLSLRAPKRVVKNKPKSKGKPKQEFLPVRSNASTGFNFFDDIYINFSIPTSYRLRGNVLFEQKVDTVWKPMPATIERLDSTGLKYAVRTTLKPSAEYRLTVDSAYFSDIYGRVSDKFTSNITCKPKEEYASLTLEMGLYTGKEIVELLNKEDKVIRSVKVDKNKIKFEYLDAGTYYARLFVDENGNGKWDTGDYDTKKQPEEVYYYPYDFQLRHMWDAEEYWHYKEIPILEQKPQALKKEVNNKKQN